MTDKMQYIIDLYLIVMKENKPFFILFAIILTFFQQCHLQTCTGDKPNSYNGDCYDHCPWIPPDLTYLDGTTCLTDCGSKYADDYTRQCVTSCPSEPILTFKDNNQMRCVEMCSTNPSEFADMNTNTCLQYCPGTTWADPDTRHCVQTCPTDTYYQVSGSHRVCTSRCYANYYADLDRICVAASSCPASPVPYYGDDSTNLCVTQCPNGKGTYAEQSTRRCVYHCTLGTYADPNSRKCVDDCPEGPPRYYGSNITRTCHLKCVEGEFADNTLGQCVPVCSEKTYGDYSTRQCVQRCPQSQDTFADQTFNLCVEVCSPGEYADEDSRFCVASTDCSRGLVADPVNLICVDPLDCPSGYFIDTVDNICVPRCQNPYWGNTDTRYCMLVCQWNPPAYTSFYDESTRTCVEQCPSNPRTFSLNDSQLCETTCPTGYFGSTLTYQCLKTCPDGFHADQDSNLCVSDCTTSDTLILYFFEPSTSCIEDCPEGYFADNTTMQCVEICPQDTYGYQTNNTCLAGCPDNFYSDDHSQMCVSHCPVLTGYYADDSTNKCVKVCPIDPDYYGEDLNDGHRKCVDQCTADNHYADPLTRTCVYHCNVNQGYFGYDTDQRCYQNCPVGWGNPLTKKCVQKCPQSPIQMFGDNLTATCVLRCPNSTYGDKTLEVCVDAADCSANYFGDDQTALCVHRCSQLLNLYGDPQSKKCVPACQHPYFSDNTTRQCELNCNTSAKLFKDYSTKTCVHLCPQLPDTYAQQSTWQCVATCATGYAVAYNTSTTKTRKCVTMCPSTPVLYADEQNKKCVTKCANLTYQFVNGTYRGCLNYCPPQVYNASHTVDLFRDNTTWKCVSVCPQGYYAFSDPNDATIRDCVPICHMVATDYYFAQQNTRTCVTQCPFFLHKTYGDRINFQCVYDCSRQQFRDNQTKLCTYQCSDGYFADNTTYMCVKECPVNTFAETINKTCVLHCPTDYFGYVNQKKCVETCDHWRYFADNTSWLCVQECPSEPDYYEDPTNGECVERCSVNRYAEPIGRKCSIALHCRQGRVADPTTNRCVERCTSDPMYFVQPSTNICGALCQEQLFADNTTNKCVEVCPSPYFGVDSVTNYYCTQYCPANQYKYANDDDTIRICLDKCPDGYFADDLTMSCVQTCPDYYYGKTGDNVCIEDCSPLYADDSTKQCTDTCPEGSTASNISYKCQDQCDYGQYQENRICETTCSSDLHADNLTRKCLDQCPDDPYTFADAVNYKCVFKCPPDHYADVENRECLQDCPEGQYKTLDFRVCVTKCPNDTWADPESLSCIADCTDTVYKFRQPFTRQCVDQCPQDPDLYGYNDEQCVERCPDGQFAQNFTRLCVDICPNVSDVYLNKSYADNLTHRCVQRCSAISYAHTNQSHSICLNQCPQGFFASQILQQCIDICPNDTYADNDTNTCVYKCPNGQYGDPNSNICMDLCNVYQNLYRDNSTNFCVQQCPDHPSLFAQDSTMQCVLSCQPGTFAYIVNRTCLEDCPDPYFQDISTGTCVQQCPIHEKTFGDKVINECVNSCDNHTLDLDTSETIFYGDPSISLCVSQCSKTPQRLYGFNETNLCLQSCPENTFGDNDTRVCLDKCVFEDPKFEWMDDVDNFCVKLCPQRYFADNITGFCEQKCSENLFADNSTRRCVATCPVSPSYYGFYDDRVCLDMCPPGLYADQSTRLCVQQCPKEPNLYFHYQPSRKCVLECLYPTFAQIESYNCVEKCQDGFYGNLTTHTCEICKPQCVTCTAFLQCTSCIKNYYLYEYQCVMRCPSYPVMYFAHLDNGVCYKKCPQPYFGQNTTGRCQLSCPVRHYGNMDTRICTECPKGCQTCDFTGCYSCTANYTYVETSLTCSSKCNSTHHYQFKGLCYLFCPDGSYLSLIDLVTCLACDPECGTCSLSPGNCTTCAKKFYYQGKCVDACPTDFFVNDQMSCISCNLYPDRCTDEPLTYTIHPFTKNYKQHAYVVFNRAVNISIQKFEQIVQIKYNGKTVSPNYFTTQIYNQTTFWVTFEDLSTLNENSITIGFEPGTIVDYSGNHLAVNEVAQEVEEEPVVTEQLAQTSQKVEQTAYIASWILLGIILLFLIKSGYPFLIALECVQFYYMFIFIRLDPIPYMQLKFLDSLKNINLLFLPQIFPNFPQGAQRYVKPEYQVFLPNTSFLYNCTPLIVVFVLFSLLYFLFFVLSRKSCIKNKTVRHTSLKIRKYRMRFMIINDAFWFTYIYAFFIAILQFTQASFDGTWHIVNFSLALIVALSFVVYTIVVSYFGYKFKSKKPPSKFAFLYMEPSAFPMELPLRYIRKMLFCFFLLLPSVDSQCISIIVLSSIFLMYIGCYMPSQSNVTNIINIIIEISYIVLAGLFYSYNKMEAKDKHTQQGYSITMIAVSAFVIFIIIIWVFVRGLFMIKESDTWDKIYKRMTENRDPDYLREMQRKRDLEFDLGSLQNRTFNGDKDSDHWHNNSGRNINIGKQTDEKFNIFDAQKDEMADATDQNSVAFFKTNQFKKRDISSSGIQSRKSDDKQDYKPSKTQEIGKKKPAKAILQIYEDDDINEIEDVKLQESIVISEQQAKKEESQDKEIEKSKIQSHKTYKKSDVRAVWDEIEFDENQI